MSDTPPLCGSGPTFTDWRDDGLSVSLQCELLASGRRRAVLGYLAARPEETVSVDALTEYLLARGDGRDRNPVTISLVHVHLPKLASAGVIEYDADRRIVQYVPHAGLERHLDFLEDI